MPRVPQRRISCQWLWGQLTIFSNDTEVSPWASPSCKRPQPATDNGVRDSWSNDLPLPHTLMGSVHYRRVHSINRCSLRTELIDPSTFSMRGNSLACATTHTVYMGKMKFMYRRCSWALIFMCRRCTWVAPAIMHIPLFITLVYPADLRYLS